MLVQNAMTLERLQESLKRVMEIGGVDIKAPVVFTLGDVTEDGSELFLSTSGLVTREDEDGTETTCICLDMMTRDEMILKTIEHLKAKREEAANAE